MALSALPLLWARLAIPSPASNHASSSIQQRVAKMAVRVTIAISATTSAMRRPQLKPERHERKAYMSVKPTWVGSDVLMQIQVACYGCGNARLRFFDELIFSISRRLLWGVGAGTVLLKLGCPLLLVWGTAQVWDIMVICFVVRQHPYVYST